MGEITQAREAMERALAALELARADKSVPGALLGALTWDFEQAERAYCKVRDALHAERASGPGPYVAECAAHGWSVTRGTPAGAALAMRLHVTVSHSGAAPIVALPA